MSLVNTKNTFERFGKEFQSQLIRALLTDKKFFEDIREIISSNYFTTITHSNLIESILTFYQEYKNIPTEQELKIIVNQYKDKNIKDNCLFELSLIENSNVNLNFYKNESLKFCKNQKIKSAIESSIKLLENEDYDRIKKIITESTQLDLKKDLGHFYEEIEKRLNTPRTCISTGYPLLDAILNGGWGNGELNVICGGPSVGKSFFLINLAQKIYSQNKNVFYYSLELSENLIGRRFDALNSGIVINDLDKRKDEATQRIKEFLAGNSGRLIIKQYPTRKASIATIENHINQLYRSEGIKPDAIVIDYADILKSSMRGEKRHELSTIYEELRGLSIEFDTNVLTASQANREGMTAEIITMANLAESFSKAAISDVILGITRTANGADTNYGNCFIAKNRSSGRDGQTLPIVFNTSLASVDIPHTDELLEKIITGEAINLAKLYFEQQNIQYKTNEKSVSEGFKNSLNKVLGDYKKPVSIIQNIK